MSEQSAPSWIGPVLGALILIGGYIAYQQWHEHDQQDKQCAALKRSFMSDMENKNESVQLMGTGVNTALDAQCPGWMHKQYNN